jgi:Arc/MetJ-type ribon-helix-helix transcriptional regulator
MDGAWMAKLPSTEVRTTRIAETEKLTINLGVVDLGQIDLLVQEGFYSNRTDLIRTAIRNQLALHGDEVRRTVARRTLVLGLQHFGRAELERAVAERQMLQIQVLGLARIANDVSPKLALAAIRSIEVLGAFHASPAVRKALADRIR